MIEELISLGFNMEQAIIIIAGLREAHLQGGDGGGPYTDFETEAFPECIDMMKKKKEERDDVSFDNSQ
jgi:hypothetical protein